MVDEKKEEHNKMLEQLEAVINRTEQMSDNLKELTVFKRIRRVGSHNQKFLVLIVASAVILYWRGLWVLYDLVFENFLPEHKVTGAIISVIIGAIVLIGTGKLVDSLGPTKLENETEQDIFMIGAKEPEKPKT